VCQEHHFPTNCIEMKNASITVWLDQETEDKVAVELTTVA